MNIILLIVILILILSVLNGYRQGLIKAVFSMFIMVIALFLASQLMPVLGKALQKTPVYTVINQSIESTIVSTITVPTDKVTEQVDVINELPLPGFLQNALIENNNSQIYDALGINDFTAYISNYLTCLILNAISFIILLIAIFIILKIIGHALNLISKLPLLNGINKIGGIVLGLVNGLIMLWIACVIITIFAGTSWAQYIFQSINDSAVLRLIYNNNYFLVWIANMGRVLF